MWNNQTEDDDDAPPPGFGPNRFEQMLNYNSGRIQPVSGPPAVEQYSISQYAPPVQYSAPHQHQQQQQQAAGYWQSQPDCQSTKYAPGQGYPATQNRGYNAGPAGASVGAVRQFQRALSSSLGERQEPAAVGAGRGRAAAQTSASPSPDYGEYNDDDDEYGAGSSSSRRGRQGPSAYPAKKSGSYHNLTSSHNNSYGNLSVSSTHSHHSQRLQTSPAPRHTTPPKSAAAESISKQPQQQQPCRTPTPDYGEYEHVDDYGSKPTSKTGSRRRTGSSAACNPVAASQALVGIPTPSRKKGDKRERLPHGGKRDRAPAAEGTGGQVKLSAERTAQLEAELAVLRKALAEAEAREIEAQMAVVHLATDNTTLQAQLEGMRTQKQQLETMLLFGGAGSETSQAGDEDDSYAYDDAGGGYSDESEDDETAAEQQQLQVSPKPLRQSWADEMDDAEGTGLQQHQQQTRSWALPDSGMAPGAADVLEAEEQLRRLGLLPDSPSDASAPVTAPPAKQSSDAADAAEPLTDSAAADSVVTGDMGSASAAGQRDASPDASEAE